MLASKYTPGDETTPALARLGNHRKAMTQAVDNSLRRRGTDCLDLYL